MPTSKKKKIQEEDSFFDVIMAGPIEEGVFRGVSMGIATTWEPPVVPILVCGDRGFGVLLQLPSGFNTIFSGNFFIKLFCEDIGGLPF